MLVRRSDVSAFFSIHRDSCVTGANAMSASFAGSGPGSALLRANASRDGPTACPPRFGFQRVAGATPGSSATLRGPTRRSSCGAIDRGQLSAAISRSEGLIVTCISFSASANVAGDTGGPAAGAVAKVGGAPGVVGAAGVAAGGVATLVLCGSLRQAIAAPSAPSGAVIRNCLRVFIAKNVLAMFVSCRALAYAAGFWGCLDSHSPPRWTPRTACCSCGSSVPRRAGRRSLAARRRLRPDRVRQRTAVVVRHVADLQVVPVGRGGVIALERGDVNLVAGGRVDLRAQAAFLELRLDPVGVPRLDAERDVIDADAPRAAASAAAAAERRIERIAAADDDVADVAD